MLNLCGICGPGDERLNCVLSRSFCGDYLHKDSLRYICSYTIGRTKKLLNFAEVWRNQNYVIFHK